ncbi:MAG: hypothetical protein ABI857_02465 [Acidobacteriota bacterium]
MLKKIRLAIILSVLGVCQSAVGQTLPRAIVRYLDGNFRDWKLAGECYEKDNKRVLAGDFDGNRQRDYAVKFVRGDKGFLMAFLARGSGYVPHYLHIYSAAEAKESDLVLLKKGESFPEDSPVLEFDSPADFRCESDVGEVHTYRKGKFIAY